MPQHPRLYKRGSVYCHRASVPKDIRESYGKVEELISLKTRSPKEAILRVRVEAARVDARFEAHRISMKQAGGKGVNAELLPDYMLKQIGADYYAFLLREDDDARLLGYEDGEQPTTCINGDTPNEVIQNLVEERLASKKNLTRHQEGLTYVVKHLKTDYAKGVFSLTFDMEDWLKSTYNLSLPNDEEVKKRYAKVLLEAELKAFTDALKRSCGEIVDTPLHKSDNTLQSMETLSYAIKGWMDEKKRTGAWSEKTVYKYRAAIDDFLSLLGDKPLQAYTKADARRFKELVMVLPANWTKLPELRNLSIAEAVHYAKSSDLKPMSQKTANEKLGLLSSFWKWATIHYDVDLKDLFAGLRIKLKNDKRDERHPFTIQQLNQLMSSPVYSGCKSPQHYLVPASPFPNH